MAGSKGLFLWVFEKNARHDSDIVGVEIHDKIHGLPAALNRALLVLVDRAEPFVDCELELESLLERNVNVDLLSAWLQLASGRIVSLK